MNWYSLSIDEVLSKLDVLKKTGLSSEEAKIRLEKYGKNALRAKEKKSMWVKMVEQFKDPMILILIAASIISAVMGEGTDAIIIIAIVLINAALSLYQEGRAEAAIEALQKMASPHAKVLRNGEILEINSDELVVGDIVELETGDIIPADLRLIESSNLKVDESSLTGESVPSEKFAEKKYDNVDISIGDRDNMCFSSCIVSYGRACGVVVETGENTEIGKIATTIQSYEEEMTPLQKKLAVLSKTLGILVIGVCVVVFGLGAFRGQNLFQMFLVAVSLAVAAIPEGLPAIVTIVLSLGMGRMAQKNAIVKKLLAVETLGTTTVICSDKTGTLTQNQMTVTKFFTNMKSYSVNGTGYEPKGDIKEENVDNVDNFINEINTDESPVNTGIEVISNVKDLTNYPQLDFMCGKNTNMESEISLLLSMSVLNNDAKLNQESGHYKIMGDPTEGSLLTLGGKIGYTREDFNNKFPRVDEIPFDSDRKMMSTFHSGFIKDNIISITKGATDTIVERCSSIYIGGRIVPMNDEFKKIILNKTSQYSSDALRVLGFSIKLLGESIPNDKESSTIEKDMIFVGIVGMIDPPREEVKLAIEECVSAGITTIMITGDHIDTAFAIARDLGIAENRDQAMLGSDLNTLSDEQIREIVRYKRVFARVSPQNKVQIVEALKSNENITAMTGDGVNDAPAIKKADIGIAMGITGTDVAKNTAEVILTDDNFATIVNAVEEGRIIFSNIKKFVSFLLSCNIGEILIMLFAILVNLPIPFLPTQLLWLNLVTDSFPALALGVEKGEKGIMSEAPRKSNEAILDKDTMLGVVFQSIAIAIATLGVYYIAFKLDPGHIEYARTMAFSTLICAELFRSYSVRSAKSSLLSIGVFTNKLLVVGTSVSFVLLLVVLYIPFMSNIFETVALSFKDWIAVIPLSLLPLIVGEAVKTFRTREK